MPTAEEINNGILSTIFKLDETGVASLKEEDGSFKPDALDNLVNLHAGHIANLRTEADGLVSSKAAAVKAETSKWWEKSLKEEFGIKDTDKTGRDLIKVIIAKSKGSDTMTEEAIKAHPLYLSLAEHANKLPPTYEEKIKAREDEIRAEFKAERDFDRVRASAMRTFKGMNPILPKNEDVANAQLTLLDQALKGLKYQLVEKDGEIADIVPMKADGSGRLEDAHGHPVKFEALIKTIGAKYFEFAEGEQREGADDPNRKGKESGKGGGDKAFDPKTVEQYANEWQRITDTVRDLAERRDQLDKLREAGRRNGVAS